MGLNQDLILRRFAKHLTAPWGAGAMLSTEAHAAGGVMAPADKDLTSAPLQRVLSDGAAEHGAAGGELGERHGGYGAGHPWPRPMARW